MLNQGDLLDKIDLFIKAKKLPRFSIVVGDRGMEHEEVAVYIAAKLDAVLVELPDVKIDSIRKMINEAYTLHDTTVYCIPHADDMSVNAKNAILKVIEEAPNKAYFVMCLEDLNNTLATIRSRGIVFRMCPLTPSMIESCAVKIGGLTEGEITLIGKICKTPGDVEMICKYGVHNLYDYARYVADNVTQVSGAEVFKFSDKLALKDEEDKFDVLLFLKTLQYILLADSIKNNEDSYHKVPMAATISNYMQDLRIKGINKTMLMDALYLEMRRIWKSRS